MDDQVGDVSVDEEVAGSETGDFAGWDAAVGATDPKVIRILPFGESLEEVWVVAA